MRRDPRRTRDERGFVMPTRLMVASISVVALAGLAFVATQSDDRPDRATPAAATPHHSTPTTSTVATPTPTPTPTRRPKPRPVVRRGQVYVEVYNNSNITGLAGKTAGRAQAVGWNVVGSDNWYGTIDTSTVYFGPRLRAAAQLLAKDLGIRSVKPAVAPMHANRLTVILTSDYR